MSNELKYLTTADGIIVRHAIAADKQISLLRRHIIQELILAYERGYRDGAAGREQKP